jgi:UPF0755 protein
MKTFKIFLVVFTILLLAAGIYFIEFFYPIKGKYEFLVSRKVPASVVAKSLEKGGFIRNAYSFLILSRITGWDKKIKAGKYKLSRPLPTFRLLYAMVYNGLYVLENPVTVKEGETIADIAKSLATIEVDTAEFLRLTRDPSFFEYLKKYFPRLDARETLEGYLYPETYMFYWAEDPRQVIFKMVSQLFAVIPDSFYDRMKELKFTLNKTLILASIIEKEAQVDFERPLISAVFHNRLRLRRPLESNVTLEYYLRERRAWLKGSETRLDTPYNTYKYTGLPPTPICSPSIKSITAALYPAKVNYLYFVAKGDGTHYFSRTFAEHRLYTMKVRSLYKQKVQNSQSQ